MHPDGRLCPLAVFDEIGVAGGDLEIVHRDGCFEKLGDVADHNGGAAGGSRDDLPVSQVFGGHPADVGDVEGVIVGHPKIFDVAGDVVAVGVGDTSRIPISTLCSLRPFRCKTKIRKPVEFWSDSVNRQQIGHLRRHSIR